VKKKTCDDVIAECYLSKVINTFPLITYWLFLSRQLF